MGNTVKSRMKITMIVAGAFVVCFVGFFVWLVTPGDTTELRAVADRFQADPSWEVVRKNVYPDQKICIDIPCGSAHYIWKTDDNVSNSQLNGLLERSGYKIIVSESCDVDRAPGGSGATICSGAGDAEGLRAQIDVTASSDPSTPKLINLRVYKG